MKIGINGFGRIGRQVFRIAYGRADHAMVRVNDITEASALAPLLQFDTTQGRFGPRSQGEGDILHVELASTGSFRKKMQRMV